MKDARKLGNYIECLAAQQNISAWDISKALGCEEHQVKRLFKGMAFASYGQVSILAELLGTTVEDLLSCGNGLRDNENREKIIDLIYDYVDVFDAVSGCDTVPES